MSNLVIRCGQGDATSRDSDEVLDAHLERSATALQQVFEQCPQPAGAPDGLLDLLELSMSQFPPARDKLGVIPQATEEEFDLVQDESHIACEADEEHAVNSMAGISALATDAIRSR